MLGMTTNAFILSNETLERSASSKTITVTDFIFQKLKSTGSYLYRRIQNCA